MLLTDHASFARYSAVAVALTLLVTASIASGQTTTPMVVTSDIARFLDGLRRHLPTEYSVTHRKLLNELFITSGSPGLHALMERRGYTASDYVASHAREYDPHLASRRDG